MKTLSGDEIEPLRSPPLSARQASELVRRLATYDEDLADAVIWDELKAELAARAL